MVASKLRTIVKISDPTFLTLALRSQQRNNAVVAAAGDGDAVRRRGGHQHQRHGGAQGRARAAAGRGAPGPGHGQVHSTQEIFLCMTENIFAIYNNYKLRQILDWFVCLCTVYY